MPSRKTPSFANKGEFDKFYDDLSKHNKDLLNEIQDLELQVLDMLELCFDFAGLRPECMRDALAFYLGLMESRDNDEYNRDQVKELILETKRANPVWFLS